MSEGGGSYFSLIWEANSGLYPYKISVKTISKLDQISKGLFTFEGSCVPKTLKIAMPTQMRPATKSCLFYTLKWEEAELKKTANSTTARSLQQLTRLTTVKEVSMIVTPIRRSIRRSTIDSLMNYLSARSPFSSRYSLLWWMT